MNQSNLKNICVYGVGGVGGYFGGLMAYKLQQSHENSHEISFVARGQHLEQIQKKGLLLTTDNQENQLCIPDYAGDKLSTLPRPDLCMVCVKSYDVVEVARDLEKHIAENTIVIPLLNGVDIYERMRAVMKRGILLPACVYITTYVAQPGVVIQKGPAGKIIVGKDPIFPQFDFSELIDLLHNQMGLDFNWETDPYPAIWKKYVLVASFALVTAYANQSFGEVLADPSSKKCLEEIMQEIISIGQKQGVDLSMDLIEQIIENIRRYPFEARTSFQRDLEGARNKNEGDIFGETILRMGKVCGVDTPISRRLFSSIREREAK